MKNLLKGFLVIPVIALSMAAGSSAQGASKAGGDERVAVVNGSVITRADLDREMATVQKRFGEAGKPLDPARWNDMRRDVLEGLINRELLHQETKKRGIQVQEAAVDERLNAAKKRFPDEKAFSAALAEADLSEKSFRAMIQRDLAIQQFFQKEFMDKASVSDQEMKTYYETHPEAFKQPAQVRASHILIRVDPKADETQKAEARKKILDIRDKIRKGADFTALAKEASDCPSRERGGDLGFFGRGQMVGPFEEAAFALKPGQMSDVVETQFGYHLIRVTESKPEGTIAFQDVKDRVQNQLRQNKARKELGDYMERARGSANIERLLKDKAE